MAVALQTTNIRLNEKKSGEVIYGITQVATENNGSLTGFWIVAYNPKTGQFGKYRLEELEAKD